MTPPLRSDLLDEYGFEHGFSLRDGAAAPIEDPSRLYQVNQVHGRDVAVVRGVEPVDSIRTLQADALVAEPGGVAVGVRTADCLAVLLADPLSGAVASVHAGWRGTVAGVVEAAAARLAIVAGPPSGWLAVTLPHILSCCFEVGDDVAQQLDAAAPQADAVVRNGGRPHVDLRAIVSHKLRQLGVPPERVEDVPGCTRCGGSRFHSYRRDGSGAGRHLAAIVSRG